eukprot:TRINITY_DN39957_c0_g1_i1.p1 TRINITY_DN39957_c0_g1~~TRINITY_DN39957_c0_g1_i1.p1  ORF type:complete len:315 (-),score=25.63 TRINITY_DN39957_c0_g1_i1:680-1582(-)
MAVRLCTPLDGVAGEVALRQMSDESLQNALANLLADQRAVSQQCAAMEQAAIWGERRFRRILASWYAVASTLKQVSARRRAWLRHVLVDAAKKCWKPLLAAVVRCWRSQLLHCELKDTFAVLEAMLGGAQRNAARLLRKCTHGEQRVALRTCLSAWRAASEVAAGPGRSASGFTDSIELSQRMVGRPPVEQVVPPQINLEWCKGRTQETDERLWVPNVGPEQLLAGVWLLWKASMITCVLEAEVEVLRCKLPRLWQSCLCLLQRYQRSKDLSCVQGVLHNWWGCARSARRRHSRHLRRVA